jgi:hypothetical protein
VGQLAEVLDSPEIAALVCELESTRWTGRPGYPIRSMIGMALAKSIYAVPTWTRTVALVREHAALRTAVVGSLSSGVPSVYARYRFAVKLRLYSDMLDRCIDGVTASLHAELPEYGRNVAIDASDMPAYANGQRFVSKNGPERERYSDPDASWGHRSAVSTRKGGGFYGYRIHASVCTATDLPVRGPSPRHASMSRCSSLVCWTRCRRADLPPRRARSIRAMTTTVSTANAQNVVACRSFRCARRPTCSAASIAPRRVSTATGCSLDRTASAALPSGAALRASASPPQSGSRLPGCTR